MKQFLLILCAMILTLGMGSSNDASAVTVAYENGTTQVTQGLTGYQTYGNMMYGMGISIGWNSGSLSDYVWGDLGASMSGISDAWGSLQMSGDTYNSYWTLNISHSTSIIDSIFFDAGTGDAVFDVVSSGSSTPGSEKGRPFTRSSGYSNIAATYSGIVKLTGEPAVGDLYRYLNLDFTTGFTSTDSLAFQMDTDSLEIEGDIHAPEPATILLLGAGILSLLGYRRRFSKKS